MRWRVVADAFHHARVEDLERVGVLDLRGDAHLAAEARDQLRVGGVAHQHLERDLLLLLLILDGHHEAHRAAAHRLDDLVAAREHAARSADHELAFGFLCAPTCVASFTQPICDGLFPEPLRSEPQTTQARAPCAANPQFWQKLISTRDQNLSQLFLELS